MWLIVGLGNPGANYAKTRHNIGFAVVDALAKSYSTSFSFKFQSDWAQSAHLPEKIFLQKPLTYMNLSAQAVMPATHFFHIPPDHVIVIHDDLDLPFGKIKIKLGGGHGGHNGLRSISASLGPEYIRVRFGIGRSARQDPSDFVLSKFTQAESSALEHSLIEATQVIEFIINHGVQAAMNRFNGSSSLMA